MKAAPVPQPLLTFGQCLKQLLTKRKLSASAYSAFWTIRADLRRRLHFMKV